MSILPAPPGHFFTAITTHVVTTSVDGQEIVVKPPITCDNRDCSSQLANCGGRTFSVVRAHGTSLRPRSVFGGRAVGVFASTALSLLPPQASQRRSRGLSKEKCVFPGRVADGYVFAVEQNGGKSGDPKPPIFN